MNENLIDDPQSSVRAAFDSVNLINELITKEVDEEKKSTVKRNVEHLEVMLTKEFFVNALTDDQKLQINNVISSGNSYLN